MQQLRLFQLQEPEWNDITINWLFEYLNANTDLKFNLKDNNVECSVKNVVLNFYISSVDLKEYTWWTNSLLVHFDMHKIKGDYQGLGFAVDNMQDFKNRLNEIIEKFKSWTC